jgi:nucleotide-binding universal stress UspA family protein
MPASPPYRHIACAIDDADASRRALAEAARVWGGGPGRLSIVHVADLPAAALLGAAVGAPPMDVDWLRDARELVAALAAELPGAETVVLTGDPQAQTVCDWAQEIGVDLLVAGVYRGMASRAMLGSFAHHLAYHAPCPVLLIGPGIQGTTVE